MPVNHQYYKELNSRNGAYYRRWTSVYGEFMSVLIDRILRSARHEKQAYNSCSGMADACLACITDKKHSYRLEMNGRSMREPV